MSVTRLAVMAGLAGTIIAVAAFITSSAAPGAAAQVRPYTPPREISGGDWSARINDILPPGVESRAEATERIASYMPDPVKYPVPRTRWDGSRTFPASIGPTPPLPRPRCRSSRCTGRRHATTARAAAPHAA